MAEMAQETLSDSVLDTRMSELTAKLGARDRTNVEKHLAACDAEADRSHGRLWRRLVTTLSKLAPMPLTTIGTHATQYFIADGKFRMQVFSLEDKADGQLLLYLPDVVQQAIADKLLQKRGEQYFFVNGSREHPIKLKPMDAANTMDPAQHVKNLIGWNRKALQLSLDATAPESPEVAAAQALCTLAAKQWAKAPA